MHAVPNVVNTMLAVGEPISFQADKECSVLDPDSPQGFCLLLWCSAQVLNELHVDILDYIERTLAAMS